MLSDGCKYTALRSQMHRFDRNCTYAADFIANTAALAVRMVRNRYSERRVGQGQTDRLRVGPSEPVT